MSTTAKASVQPEDRLGRIQEKIKRKEEHYEREIDQQRQTIGDLEGKLMEVDRKESKRMHVIS